MSIGGIYIAPRGLVTFLSEFLWLALSSAMLVGVGCWAQKQVPTAALVLDRSLIIVTAYVAAFYLMDLYAGEMLKPRRALLQNLGQAVGLMCIGLGLLTLATRGVPFAPPLVLTHASLTVLFVIVGRTAIDRIQAVNPAFTRIGLVVHPATRRHLEQESRRRRDLGLRFEWLGDSLGRAAIALSQVSASRISPKRLVIDPSLLEGPEALEIVRKSREKKIVLEDLANFAEKTFGKVFIGPQIAREVAWAPLVSTSEVTQILRRLRDLVVALAILILSLPLWLLLLVAIKCDSAGPALFAQERIGKDGRRFKMLKFRSMFHGTRAGDPWGWTTRERDPRVTRVGRVMRSLHLDELPQLINVIRGEMSIVGPRPFHPDHVKLLASHSPYLELRQLVMPGMTGWAQISCDYEASVDDCEEVVSRDLYYIKHAGLLFDTLILAETLRVCLWRRGAR
jgi:lipopolysaccharide/colanic/teichoic acid biosynthesis glycosyltransferase